MTFQHFTNITNLFFKVNFLNLVFIMTNTIFHMQQLCAHRPVKMEALVQDLVFVSAHQVGLETDVKQVKVYSNDNNSNNKK